MGIHLKSWKYLLVLGMVLWGCTIILSFLIPPFQAMDEIRHFLRAYSWTEGQWQCTMHDGQVGVWSPTGVGDAHLTTGLYRLPHHPEIPYVPGEVAPSPEATRVFLPHTYCERPPTAYIPQIIGITIGKILQLDTFGILLVARLLNALAGVILILAAVFFVPYGKTLVLLLGISPMLLYQFASASPDSVLYAGSIFFLAYTWYLSRKPTLRKGNLILYFFVITLATNIRVGYQLLATAILLLKPQQFSKRLWYILYILVCVLGVFCLFTFIRNYFSSHTSIFSGIDRGEQVWFILQNPLEFIVMIWRTFQVYGWSILLETFGSIGWQDRHLTFLHYILLITVGFWVLVGELGGVKEASPTRREQIVFLMTGILVFGSICAGLFILSTHPGSPIIIGLQGKYFLPVLFCILMAIIGLKSEARTRIVALACLCIISTIWLAFDIHTRYYAPLSKESTTWISYPIEHPTQFRILAEDSPLPSVFQLRRDVNYPAPLVPYELSFRDLSCRTVLQSIVLQPAQFVTTSWVDIELPSDLELTNNLCIEIRATRSLGGSIPLFLWGTWSVDGFLPILEPNN